MPAVARFFVSICFEIAKQLRPILLVKIIELPPARTFDSEPDPILIHDCSHAREWQSMKSQRLSVARCYAVDCVWHVSQNLIRAVTQCCLIHGRKPSQTLPPKMFSLKT